MDCVQDIFDFFQSNLSVYKNGSLHKLFRVLDIKLANFLRSILMSSLHSWKDLAFQYTNPIENDNLIKQISTITVEDVIKVNENDTELLELNKEDSLTIK